MFSPVFFHHAACFPKRRCMISQKTLHDFQKDAASFSKRRCVTFKETLRYFLKDAYCLG